MVCAEGELTQEWKSHDRIPKPRVVGSNPIARSRKPIATPLSAISGAPIRVKKRGSSSTGEENLARYEVSLGPGRGEDNGNHSPCNRCPDTPRDRAIPRNHLVFLDWFIRSIWSSFSRMSSCRAPGLASCRALSR